MQHHLCPIAFSHIWSVVYLRCWNRVKIYLDDFNFSIFIASALKSVSICFIYTFIHALPLVSLLIFFFTDLPLILSWKDRLLNITAFFLFLIRKFNGVISFRKEEFLRITVMRYVFVHMDFLSILLSTLGIFHQGKIATSKQRKCYFVFFLSGLYL